jgi:hypothetical protein
LVKIDACFLRYILCLSIFFAFIHLDYTATCPKVNWKDGATQFRKMEYSPSKIKFTAKYTMDQWLCGKIVSLSKLPRLDADDTTIDNSPAEKSDDTIRGDNNHSNSEGEASGTCTATVQLSNYPGTILTDLQVTNTSKIRPRHHPLHCQLFFIHRRLKKVPSSCFYSHVPKLFGAPFILRLSHERSTVKDLYNYVLDHVRRFCPSWKAKKTVYTEKEKLELKATWTGAWIQLNPKKVPIKETCPENKLNNATARKPSRIESDPNEVSIEETCPENLLDVKRRLTPQRKCDAYAGEWEEKLSEYPFRLCRVKNHGIGCALASWSIGSHGAIIPPDQRTLISCIPNNATIAIDWDPSVLSAAGTYSLHEEQRFHTHESIEQHNLLQNKPIGLTACLEKFAVAEKLTAYCSKCTRANSGDFTETKQEKKMEVWALPPLLVVQLKRFKTVQRPSFFKNSPVSTYSYKLNNVIDIPEQLDLSTFIAKDAHAYGDKTPQDKPRMLREEEWKRLQADVAKLEAGDLRNDPKAVADIKKRLSERDHALKNDEMVRAIPLSLSRDNVKYELFGVCHHAGNIKAGHYYAYVKSAQVKDTKNDKQGRGIDEVNANDTSLESEVPMSRTEKIWRLCNDSRVSDAKSYQEVTSNGAYLLYYQRSDLKKSPVVDIYPQFYKDPPVPKIIDKVTKSKWNAPKQANGSRRRSRNKKNARRGDNGGLALSSCSIQ